MKPLDFSAQKFKPIVSEKMPPLWAIDKYFNFYDEQLKPLILQYATQNQEGMHGLNTHTNAVVFRGIDYALHMGQDPMPVVFACAFHDMARVHDDLDFDHGKNAVPMATKIMKNFPDLFSKETKLSILSAIMNHTSGTIATDYIAACLWDADRTRLSWKYGFNEKFFNTKRGVYVASSHFAKYITFQKKCFPYL
ncbi:MAG: hypothetical protein IKO56_01995, partial [Alphaproteobacteria bacterium]|nr:hypothetical protein [Alphaproteobacteria bacterium]